MNRAMSSYKSRVGIAPYGRITVIAVERSRIDSGTHKKPRTSLRCYLVIASGVPAMTTRVGKRVTLQAKPYTWLAKVACTKAVALTVEAELKRRKDGGG